MPLFFRLLLALLLFSPALTYSEIRLIDDTQTEVVLEKPAERIISLAPYITESVFAVDAGEKLVGLVSYSDYPKAALSLSLVGTYKKVSMEQIAALKPDLILSFGSGNGWEMINRLRQLGFTVFVDEPRSLEDVARSLERFSKLAGIPDQGKTAADSYTQEYQRLKSLYVNRKPVSVFYEVWNQPLLTINGKHLISDIIRLCGGYNIFQDAKPLAPKVSIEAIIRHNPDVIIASGMGEERPEWLDEWRAWPSLKAVEKGQLYFIPPDILQRHTPRLLQGAKLMCGYIEQARSTE